jgi:hypothetical protein
VSKEGSKVIGMGLKMRKVVLYGEDEAAMWVTGGRLHGIKIVEAYIMMFSEILLRDNAWGSAP